MTHNCYDADSRLLSILVVSSSMFPFFIILCEVYHWAQTRPDIVWPLQTTVGFFFFVVVLHTTSILKSFCLISKPHMRVNPHSPLTHASPYSSHKGQSCTSPVKAVFHPRCFCCPLCPLLALIRVQPEPHPLGSPGRVCLPIPALFYLHTTASPAQPPCNTLSLDVFLFRGQRFSLTYCCISKI